MLVIPAIDLLEEKAVRLRQGDYGQVTVYDDDPPRLAAEWSGAVERLHVVDLEGARQGRPVQRDLIRRIVAAFGPGVQVGGGVRTLDTVQEYFELGVESVVLGTAAVRDPALVRAACERYPGRIIVAVDARDGRVMTDGWQDASERSALELVTELSRLPIYGVLYTDIERDGTEVGPNVPATAELAAGTGVRVIASGGVGTLEHLESLAHASNKITGAIVGRALHEKRFSLEQAVQAARGSSGAPGDHVR